MLHRMLDVKLLLRPQLLLVENRLSFVLYAQSSTVSSPSSPTGREQTVFCITCSKLNCFFALISYLQRTDCLLHYMVKAQLFLRPQLQLTENTVWCITCLRLDCFFGLIAYWTTRGASNAHHGNTFWLHRAHAWLPLIHRWLHPEEEGTNLFENCVTVYQSTRRNVLADFLFVFSLFLV